VPGAGVPFTIGVPQGWHRLEQGDPGWAAALAGSVADARGFDAEQRERLRALLAGVQEQAARQNRQERVRLVHLGRPEQPAVRAWAFLELYPSRGLDAESFAAAMAEPPVETATRVRDRKVTRESLAGLPAVVVHDLLTVVGRHPVTLQHRVVATLFAPGELAVQLQLSTPDLTAFADLPAVARAMADSIRLAS
jgi:hypothetical protein